MTTVREARIEAARKALYLHGRDVWLDPTDGQPMAEDVVDALFPADPIIDNAEMPQPKTNTPLDVLKVKPRMSYTQARTIIQTTTGMNPNETLLAITVAMELKDALTEAIDVYGD